MMADQLLTISEVAEIVRLNYHTVRTKIHNGEIPAIDLSPNSSQRTVRVKQSDLDRWLNSNRIRPTEKQVRTISLTEDYERIYPET